MLQHKYPDPVRFSPDTFRLQPKKRDYKFSIPFEQGKYEYDTADIRPFLDSIATTKFTILKAEIAAFASVEGSEEINLQLQKRRAESLLLAMQAGQRDTIQHHPRSVATGVLE